MDRGVGVTIGRRVSSSIAETLKLKELEGEPLLDASSLRALIRLLRLAQVRLTFVYKILVSGTVYLLKEPFSILLDCSF